MFVLQQTKVTKQFFFMLIVTLELWRSRKMSTYINIEFN